MRWRAIRPSERSIWERRRMLELRDVRAGYGDAVVLDGVSFEVPANGRLAILGRNGVGKSTLLLSIMGYTRLHRGEVFWDGGAISALPAHQRAPGHRLGSAGARDLSLAH